ncbi:MAG: beta-ketoacyl reductase, partial [Cyanobacteria bacterium P01_F01_bin.4]
VNASGRWLILADRGGLGQALGTQLAHAGQECILAFAADVDQPQAPSKESPIWHLNPSEPRQFEQLLQAVFSPGELPLLGIIHLWSLDTPPTAELTADALAQSQLLSVGSALHLVQALGQLEEKAESNAGKPAPRLWLVTQNAMPVSDAQPTIAVAQSSLWGLGKVIALEHPSLWGGLIDLGDDIPDVAAVVARALLAADDEDQLAFRADQRYVARLVRAANPPQSASVPLHRDGTYLITGGLGALGLQVAKWLVKQGARHLVLIGRRPPSGSAWVVIEYLEQLGVEIHIAQADVAGFDELAQVFKGFETSMPPLRGLVHTAGVLDDGALWQQNWDRFVGVMRPKVQGAWNLHCLTHKTPLDFFLNFSSVIALLGNPGQSNYAAANVFLDALAHFRQSLGQPTLSVNWGLWEQGGMASASLEAKLGRMGIKPLPSAPALAALTTLLADTLTNPDRAQAAVASIDWSVFKELHGASGQQPLLVELKGTSPLPAAPPVSQQNLLQTLQTIPASEYTQHLVVYCQNLVAKTLSIRPDQLDRDQALNYLGLDSLMAIQLRNLIKNQLQVNIPTAKFMAGLSVDSLASLIAEALPTTLQPVAPFTDESSDLLPKTLEPDPVNQSQATQPTTAKQMLDNLDQLADEDVDALLQTLLTE